MELRMSRIPVMQALRRLETEGFVRITPHKDVVVTQLSPEDFRTRFLLMAMLEAFCLRESSGKITPDVLARLGTLQAEIVGARKARHTARAVAAEGEFHRSLWDLAGLRQTAQIFQNLWDRGEYYRIIMHARRKSFAQESLAEHAKILRALERRDILGAAAALEQHPLRPIQRLGGTA
jgi:DNA-binding GntR family transcriptional regulator